MSSEFTLDPDPATIALSDTLLCERIADAHHHLHTRLATTLLQRVKQSPPAFFEQLVIDLLLAMGYGHRQHHQERGTRSQEPCFATAQLTPASADGGIDGIIHQDPLGLDPIYLQAKRWEHPVGEPQLRDFIGALDQVRGHKGIFLTTSEFTQNARTCASLATPKIILIDGPQLAELMISHSIGVSSLKTYELKQIDPHYFSEA